jgi:L-ribulose-5-phosphate 4-epimerase
VLEALRDEICALHQELPRNSLVTWTGGNLSGRDTASGLVVIKPSGIRYQDLQPEHLVVVDLQGRVVEGALKPSSDTASHLFVYRQRADVRGVVHTHSPYATAFAALGKPIPVYLTAQADEFGGAIPCAPFARIGGEEIGRAIVESIGACSAVLLKSHGVFTIGATPEAALKSAVMVEDVARTVWIALQIGQPEEIPASEVEKLHHRYTHVYGQ